MAIGDSLLKIDCGEGALVSAVFSHPPQARACYVFAHGAGAGMQHAFMAALSAALAERGVATLRFQFPYMERGSRRTDPPPIARAAVRAAITRALDLMPNAALFAGGKSFGGRMTSQAQAELPLPGVRGLIFVGFPLHPAGKPSLDRAEHLSNIHCPMLFLQGTRDDLADLELISDAVMHLGNRATLKLFEDADHSFHVRARSGRTDAQVLSSLADGMVDWMHTDWPTTCPVQP